MAEKLLRAAHAGREVAKSRRFAIDPALATSMGLAPASFALLLREAGFRQRQARVLTAGAFGPPAPELWEWRPQRKSRTPPPATSVPVEGSAFAALAGLMR
ncbi:MAG: hypothetical protein R3D83_08620 [Caenibius sp.]